MKSTFKTFGRYIFGLDDWWMNSNFWLFLENHRIAYYKNCLSSVFYHNLNEEIEWNEIIITEDISVHEISFNNETFKIKQNTNDNFMTIYKTCDPVKQSLINFKENATDEEKQQELDYLNKECQSNSPDAFEYINKINNMERTLDYKKIITEITEGVNKYLDDNNINTMVLGLSGGIDSTLVAALGYLISKKYGKKLIGVSLPSSTNENDENTIATRCGEQFCDKFITHDITSDYQQLQSSCNKLSKSNNLANGNIKARIRMIELYHIAGTHKGIVLDTDNLTEHYLGFFTIHGDVADLNPIGDLWKHEIYDLTKWIINSSSYFDDETNKTLQMAVDITPTDGNGVVAGGDMAQIAPGCTYEDVDDILYSFIKSNTKNIDEFIRNNCSKFPSVSIENMLKILKRHMNSEYKRNQLPIKINL